jgi:hypothetical protein
MQLLCRRLKPNSFLVVAVSLLTGVAGRGAIPSLRTPAHTAGRFSCGLRGASNATYVVLASTNLSDWMPVATNRDAAESRTVDFPVPYPHALFRVQTLPMSGLAHALAARGQITISGSLDTDSFNSEDPVLSTDGQYDPAKSRDHGDVATQPELRNRALIWPGSLP